MGKKTNWKDDYWLYVMQLYMRRPIGVKPLYSKAAVDLSMEIHVHPREIMEHEMQIETLSSPRVERIWDAYGDSPSKLSRAVKLLRSMKGFGSANAFYDGVEVTEGFEPDFRPISSNGIMPISLVIILDLYFRLTPITMSAETPEVWEVARLMGLPISTVVHVLHMFLSCDPYTRRKPSDESDPLLPHCRAIWTRYGNSDAETLSEYAEELKQYFH